MLFFFRALIIILSDGHFHKNTFVSEHMRWYLRSFTVCLQGKVSASVSLSNFHVHDKLSEKQSGQGLNIPASLNILLYSKGLFSFSQCQPWKTWCPRQASFDFFSLLTKKKSCWHSPIFAFGKCVIAFLFEMITCDLTLISLCQLEEMASQQVYWCSL